MEARALKTKRQGLEFALGDLQIWRFALGDLQIWKFADLVILMRFVELTSPKDYFILIFSGIYAMITTYLLLYPILGNPIGDKVLGIIALIWIFSVWIVLKKSTTTTLSK